MDKLEDYFKRRKEKALGEERKIALDDFTKKRLGLEDYTLVRNVTTTVSREVLEVYHDPNRLLNIENFQVSLRNNLKYSDASLYLNVSEVEKILLTLHEFVKKNKKEET
jgi:hypothetical protein